MDGELKLIGVTSGGRNGPYNIGAEAFDNRVDVFESWIEDNTKTPSAVKATFSNGNLTLRGGSGDNEVYVADGWVLGVGATTINGASAYQLPDELSGNLTLQFTKGNTKLFVTSQDVGGNVIYKGGKQADSVWFESISIGGNLNAKGGNGSDSLRLNAVEILGTLNANLGGGNDQLHMSDDSSTQGKATFTGGNGNDEIVIQNASFGDDLFFKTGGGGDFVFIDSVQITESLNANMGGGSDDLYATGITTNGSAAPVLNGAGGNDDLQQVGNSFATAPRITFEGTTVPNAVARANAVIDKVFEDSLFG